MKKIIMMLILSFSTMTYANKPAKLTVILDWFANPDHAALFVTEQQGFFKAENLAVTFVGPSDPAEPPKMIAAKKADLAITYQPQLIQQVARGMPLVRIATLIATPLDCLAVNAHGAIKTLHDLKGKKIAYSSDSNSLLSLQIMLHSVGLKLTDVTTINVHYNLTQALLSGKVDATIGVMRNFEITQLRMAGFKAYVFYPEEHGMPLYDELVMIAHRDNIADERIARFLQALELGTHYLVNHPQESWLQFAKNHPELNNELNRQAWFDTIPRLALRPAALDHGRYQRLALFMVQQKIIPHRPLLKEYAVEVKRNQ